VAVTRRTFLVSSAAAAGYALSVRPISAATLETSSEGLDVADVSIPVPGGSMPAYTAAPAKAGALPTVIVVHEIFGVHEHIRDVCRRLAKSGFRAIAPNLYHRHGDATKYTEIEPLIKEVVSKTTDEEVFGDLDATVAYLKAQPAKPTGIGITGFCWGGRVVWMYGAHSSELRAGVAWYGRLVPRPDAPANAPKQPVDVAKDLKIPVLGLYGEKDDGIPLDTVEKMRAALEAAGKPSEIKVYDGAQHGFHADYRPSYLESAAKDGYQRMVDWFRKNGVA
jgi:carboxymethylenebutenolidase